MNQRPMEDHMNLISQPYPSTYTQITPQQDVQSCSNAEADIGPIMPIRRRNKKRKGGENCGIKKRKLSAEQVNLLEQNFGNEHKLESEKKDRLASELGLDPRQVAVWFQNRRARWKKKKLEEEYSNLKNAHETIMMEKCHLETKLLKLKEKVFEAEKEIQRLLECADKAPSNNHNSSLSHSQTQPKEVVDPPFLGEFRVEGYDDDVLYLPSTHYTNDMEWVYLYL